MTARRDPSDRDRSDGGPEESAEAEDPATDALDLLADETRVAILRELAEHRRASPGDPALSFTDLRERVGAVDSGRFNYHLEKLCGRFVRDAEEGYELGYAGQAVIDAARGDVLTDDAVTDAPTAPDEDGRCPVCGEDDCNRLIHVHLRDEGW